MKNNISLETYHERDLQALAESLANCCYNRVAGRCQEDHCINCDIDAQWNNCYNELSDIDKQRVRNMARTKMHLIAGSAITERFLLGKQHRLDISTDKGISRWLLRTIFRIIFISGGVVCVVIFLLWLYYGLFFSRWSFPPW